MTKYKKLFRFLGKCLMILAVVFLFRRLLLLDMDYSVLFQWKNFMIFLILMIIQIVQMMITCIPWGMIEGIFIKKKVPYPIVVSIWGKSNILKYVPGNVFQYVGKNQLAIKMDAGHIEVAAGTMADLCLFMVASLILIVLCGGLSLFHKFSFQIPLLPIVIGIFVLMVSAIVGLLKFKTQIQTFILRYKYLFTVNNTMKVLLGILIYLICCIISNLIYFGCLRFIIGQEFSLRVFYDLMGALTFSWLLGFVTPGAPGGLGIRESVMLLIAGGMIPESSILLSMVIFRIIGILSDLILYFIANLFQLNYSRPE